MSSMVRVSIVRTFSFLVVPVADSDVTARIVEARTETNKMVSIQGFLWAFLAKTQIVQNAKTQFENTKTQFEN